MITKKISTPGFSILLLAILFSCGGPTIHYLGNTLPPTTEIKEYFDEKEITSRYRVIGTMTNEKVIDYDVEDIRKRMIRKAQEVGADAILYSPIQVEYDHKDGDRTAVQAKLLKFE